MYLRPRPFSWPWRCADAIRSASTDAARPGLHQKPLNTDYSLCITQAAARAIINSTIMKHEPNLLAVLMAIAMRWYYTAQIARWRRFMAFI